MNGGLAECLAIKKENIIKHWYIIRDLVVLHSFVSALSGVHRHIT